MGLIKQIQTDLEMGAVRLFNEYYARLLADARELYKDNGLAEDAAMATLEQFISCREKYDPAKGELYPWLKTIMRNNFISSKRVRKNTDTLYVSPEELKILSDSQANPLHFDEKISRDEEKIVVEAVKTLSPKLREAVMLHYFDDQPLANIARYLKISESSVKNRLFCARKILAHRLADKLGKKKPLAILLAFLFGAGALFGAWQAGVALVEAMSNGENNQTTLTTKQEVPKMNTLTKLAAPLLVATLSTTAPAVQAEPIVHKLDSLSYVQKNLIAQWDGIENKARGEHDSSITYWTDLTGNGYDFNNFTQNVPTKFSENALVTPTKEEYASSYGIAVKNSSKKNVTGLRAFDIYLKQNQKNRSGQDHSFMIAFVDKRGDPNGGYLGLAYSPNGIQINNLSTGAKQHSIHNGDFNPHYFYFCYSADYKTASDSVIDGAQVNFSGLTAGTKGGWNPSEGMEIGYFSNYEPCANFYGMRVYGAALTPTQAKLNYAIDRKRFSNVEETLPEGYEWVGEEDARDIVIKGGITIGEYQNGSVYLDGVKVESGVHDLSLGHDVMLTAVPEDGCVFSSWEASNPVILEGLDPSSPTITLKGSDASLGTIWPVMSKIEYVKVNILSATGNQTFVATVNSQPIASGDMILSNAIVSVVVTPKEDQDCTYDEIPEGWAADAAQGAITRTFKAGANPFTIEIPSATKILPAKYYDWGWERVLETAKGDKCVVAFTQTGVEHTWALPSGVTKLEYLIVGGGAGGGGSYGGGGGAGGYLATLEPIEVGDGASLTITVGAGGAGGASGANGEQGGDSSLKIGSGTTITAFGGGFGGGNWTSGGLGGSGGGGGGHNGKVSNPGEGTAGQGNAGGKSTGAYVSGGSGGGAGGKGADGAYYSQTTTPAGAGKENVITGRIALYAQGGEGGSYFASGTSGLDGTGSGGGGGKIGNAGAKGGSGIVILRYAKPKRGLMLMIF